MKENSFSELVIFGENLAYIARCNHFTTYKDFANYIGYDRETLGKIYNGEQNIKLNTAIKIARKTGYSLSSLFNNSFQDDSEYRERNVYQQTNELAIFLETATCIMRKKNISQSEICSTTGIDKADLSNLFNGKTKNPTLHRLLKISNVLQISLSNMLGKDD